MNEGQDQTRESAVPDRNADRNAGRIPAQTPDEPPRPPRMADPRKDEATAARPSEAKRVTEPTRAAEPTRTTDAPRTSDAARTTDATRTSDAARSSEGTGLRTAETHSARHSGPAGAGDGLEERLQHAMGTFVDEPRKSVEEADAVLEQVARQLTEKLAERRRTLRSTWQNDDAKADTEELRVALTHYRDLTQQLLSI